MTMPPRSKRPLWTRLSGRAIGLLGVIGIILIVLISLPILEVSKPQVDPAADAEAAYQSLLAQVSAGEEVAPLVQQVARDVLALAEEQPADAATSREVAPPPHRDLFAPVAVAPATRAPRPPAARRPARPRLPALTGILIDGARRRAMIDECLVAVGDDVGAYRLIAIDADGVTLEWQTKTYRLELGVE